MAEASEPVLLGEWLVSLYVASDLPDDVATQVRKQASAALDDRVRDLSQLLAERHQARLEITQG